MLISLSLRITIRRRCSSPTLLRPSNASPPVSAAPGETRRGRDRGRAVAGAERIVLALGAARIPGDAAVGAQGVEALEPAGEQPVRIAFVSDVPDDLGT